MLFLTRRRLTYVICQLCICFDWIIINKWKRRTRSTSCFFPHQKILIAAKVMAGQWSVPVCISIVHAIFKRNLSQITIFQTSESIFPYNFWAIIPKLSGYVCRPKTKFGSIIFFILMPITYPESLGIIAQKLKEKVDFEIWKMVIACKSRLKIAHTIEVHTSADLWPAITLATISIF